MKTFTRAEFNDLPVVDGRKQCPTGDYSAIDNFPAGCVFGAWATFGDAAMFGAWATFGEGCVATSPYWDFIYEPPFKIKGRILPSESAREHWRERTGLKLEGCYGSPELECEIKANLDRLLERSDWTKCERRILESWKEYV